MQFSFHDAQEFVYLFIYRFLLLGWKTRGRKCRSSFFYWTLLWFILQAAAWLGVVWAPGRWDNARSLGPSSAAAEIHRSKSQQLQSNSISYSEKWQSLGWALPSHLYNSQDSSSILKRPRIPGRELHVTFCLFCINFIWKRQDCEDFGMGALFQLRLLETILLLRVITQ